MTAKRSPPAQMRASLSPALFSYGFRPFFLFGSLWAVAAMAIWLAVLVGWADPPTRFDPHSWHAHEFLFGYLGAVVAGFMLTAVPNWTGRAPIAGWRLVWLFALWAAGRFAIVVSAAAPPAVAPVIDLAFPLALGALILREIVASANWRNLIMLALLMIFALANALFHLEALSGEYAAQGTGLRLGLATALTMIALIGGRIIPSFTRNWLMKTGDATRPAPPMQAFDKIALLGGASMLALWVFRPFDATTGWALLIFGALHLVRLARWRGDRAGGEPLVWALHAGYAFLPFGAFALGVDLLVGASWAAGAQHLWMAGAIGLTSLAVMTRASLGHTGRALAANRTTTAIYFFVAGAAATRFLAPLLDALSYVSGVLWLLAFAGFAVAYGPSLLRRRSDAP